MFLSEAGETAVAQFSKRPKSSSTSRLRTRTRSGVRVLGAAWTQVISPLSLSLPRGLTALTAGSAAHRLLCLLTVCSACSPLALLAWPSCAPACAQTRLLDACFTCSRPTLASTGASSPRLASTYTACAETWTPDVSQSPSSGVLSTTGVDWRTPGVQTTFSWQRGIYNISLVLILLATPLLMSSA